MEEKITLKEFERRWNVLLERTVVPPCTTTSASEATVDPDPFDCSDLVIPPTYELADQVASDYVQRWRELDERKISAAAVAEEEAAAKTALQQQQPNKRARVNDKKNPYWYDKHVRFPPGFDYETRLSEPPEDDGTGDQVLNLLDPTKRTSYHQELWKLFADIPTAQQLEEQVMEGIALPHTRALVEEIVETTEQQRVDGHALSRLRKNDRHDLPPLPSQPSGDSDAPSFSTLYTSTIRFECWRRQPKRGVMSDPDRMVVEFLGSQTLLDFHRTLVQHSEDELWSDAAAGAGGAVTTTDDSGFFFIEGVFYTTGSVDYTSSIKAWLADGSRPDRKKRAAYLGVDLEVTSTITTASMADTTLEDISLRLGVRYLHVCHGDVETAVFCSDRRLARASDGMTQRYPVLHDVWTPSYPTPTCEACQHSAAVIATSTTCTIVDSSHRTLCEACARQLGLQVRERNHIERYSTWRNQANLSRGTTRETTF